MDEHVDHRVPARLARSVRHLVGYRAVGLRPGVHLGLPSTGLTLVLPIDEPLDVDLGGHRARYRASLAGLHTSAARIRYQTTQIGVQLSIDPLACRRLLGVPAAELAENVVELDTAGGSPAARLLDAAASAPSLSAGCAAVADLLDPAEPGGLRRELTNAWGLILRSHGRVSVGWLADAVGWSRRHLEQQFRRELGVSPSQACALRRFEHAVDLVRDRHELAEAAALAGFTDQPHLTRVWRDRTGTTPGRWRSTEQLAFVQDSARALTETREHG